MSVKNFLVSPGPPIDTVRAVKDGLESRVAGPGDEVALDPELRHNARQIASGRLVEQIAGESGEPTKAELDQRARELDIDGRSKMNAGQLKAAIAEAEAAANPDKENA